MCGIHRFTGPHESISYDTLCSFLELYGTAQCSVPTWEQGILKDIQKGTRDGEKEEPVARAEREFQSLSVCSVKSAEWSLSNGLLYFQGKIYVLDTSNLHQWIISLSHNSQLAGHSRR